VDLAVNFIAYVLRAGEGIGKIKNTA
jgi:hypothetical protein